MPLSLKKYLLFFLLLFSGTGIYSQTISSDKVRSLTVDDGLPQGFITGIVQDQQGFMWLSTLDGLARYDGRNIKVWHHDATDSNSIATNVVTGLYVDRENNLWLVHENYSVDILNTETNIVRHISKEKSFDGLKFTDYYAYNFLEDKAHEYWVITKNQTLEHFNLNRLSPVRISFSQNELPQAIYEDKSGNLWIHTNKALYVIAGKYQLRKISDLPAGTHSNFLGNIFIDRKGNLWVGHPTYISLYNIVQHTWRQINLPANMPVHHKTFAVTSDGRIYLNAMQNVYAVSNNYDFSLIWSNNTNPPELTAFMIDRSNNIWCGTNTFGARIIDLSSTGFTAYKLPYNFYRDVFLSSLHLYSSGNTPMADYILRSCTDKKGDQWFINMADTSDDQNKIKAVILTKIKGNSVTRIYLRKEYSNGWTDDDGANNFCFDENGNCWVIMNSDTLGTVDFKNKLIINPVALNNNDETPGYLVSANNKLWIVYLDALQSFDPKTKQSVWYKDQPGAEVFRNAYLLMAVSDPKDKNILWISSRGNGLIQFDTKTGISKSFTTKDGLPNNTVYTIVPDKDGYLWCSSNKGIFRFSPADYSVLSFTVKDGLQGNEFNRYQFLNFPDGKIAFGGTQGWTIFHPDSITVDSYQPNIALTDIEINNEPIATFTALKNKAVVAIDTLRLSYDENFLTFHFAGLQYNDPEKLQYRHMLTSIDKKWVDAGTQNSANYTNLSPGTYDLKIDASNTAGIWSSYIKTIHIIIAPPWWNTWWAYTLYVIAMATVMFIIFRIRLNQAKTKQEMELKKKEADQLKAVDEIKSRFFSNITHEFRTPLSLIISPVEQMQQDEGISPGIKKRLSAVQRNAKHLLRLINQLLDLSKLESGNMKVVLSRGQIKSFVEEIVQSFEQKAESKQIELGFESSCPDKEYLFDTEKWEKIVTNLLSNAIKFTPENGKVTGQLSATGKDAFQTIIHLRVVDTGSGIPGENLPFIFQRFYQVDDSGTRKYEGTGIGLSLVKELTELMKGSIEVESREGTGTTFDVFIPVTEATDNSIPSLTKSVSLQESSPDIIKRDTVIVNQQDKNNVPLILVVEDNPELCEFISESLGKKYRTCTASNGNEGLQIAKEMLPELIISDVMMPEMDGYAFCREIKSRVQTDHIGVILLTAKAAQESVIEGLQVGADDYITKPFHFDELELRIRNILDRQEKLRLFFKNQLSNPDASLDKSQVQNDFITQLYSIIDEHLDDSNLNVEKLATKAAVSHRTLNRKLSSLIGLSANELIKQYRLKRSVEFLKSGHNISETAYSVGFETHSHFTTSFKSFFGVTPTEYVSTKISN